MPERSCAPDNFNDDPSFRQHHGRSGDNKTRNHHPTVKPIALMRYLCRLATPPNGTILDPFCGSGSTGIAAIREGFNFIGMERDEEYVAIAQRRIEHALAAEPPLFAENVA